MNEDEDFKALRDRAKKRAQAELLENQAELPIGTPVAFSSDGWKGTGLVTGHDYNMLYQPIVLVDKHAFYHREVHKLENEELAEFTHPYHVIDQVEWDSASHEKTLEDAIKQARIFIQKGIITRVARIEATIKGQGKVWLVTEVELFQEVEQ